ncbi:hypothetical protein NDS46_26840 [Paenibacillus thiaminolyticus]|uniref:hypothetical protein n=1 Tax=Paenibacillus thiaminolyticus TaxID=49283 RepID=UPI002330F85B|nr:hypothetical protein [Paenibacillus thiaminolyticus]WCF07848.1 hypothetical protein NDS46_26840 [Paenibacillus thiaminolyticus]
MSKELLRYYRKFGPMSPHAMEFLQIYINLLSLAPNRRDTGEIPALLQDSPFGEAVHI